MENSIRHLRSDMTNLTNGPLSAEKIRLNDVRLEKLGNDLEAIRADWNPMISDVRTLIGKYKLVTEAYKKIRELYEAQSNQLQQVVDDVELLKAGQVGGGLVAKLKELASQLHGENLADCLKMALECLAEHHATKTNSGSTSNNHLVR